MAETFRVLLSDSLAPQGIEVLKGKFSWQLKFDIKTGLKPEELAQAIAPYDAPKLIRSSTRVTREVDRRQHLSSK